MTIDQVCRKLKLVSAAGICVFALTLMVETVFGDVTSIAGSSMTDAALLTEGYDDYKPDDKPDSKPDKKPDEEGGGEEGGGETPPDKPGEGGGEGGGGTGDSVALTGVLQLDGGSESYDGGTLASTNSDENVILAQSNACLTVSNYTLNKSGDTSSEDNSNFFALNAVVAARAGGTNRLDNCVLNSNAEGANCMFATGAGSTIYAYNCTLTSSEDSSRGLDATYEGTVIASKMSITTKGDHCASLATDRGNGYISATDSTLSTAGNGSALIYSTGVIEANCVTGTATGAQIAGIEGLSTIRIKNSCLSGSARKASEPVANGVIIYQSNSGDSSDGTATFEVSDSTLSSAITQGAMFYITHSEAVITVRNTTLDFDSDANYLIKAAGNDGSNGWGNAGSNGAGVIFTAINQNLKGNVSVDGISSNDLYLVNSTFTGTFERDSTYEGDGGANVFIDGDSTWIVTSNCTLKSLTVAANERIRDGNGAIVPIVDADGQTIVSGTSDLKVSVGNYTVGEFVATNITDFSISRTAFEAIYGTSESQEGDGGGSGGGTGGGVQDHNNWTNYFKPHPPENAIVKVKVAGATEYGTPDRDHKYCLDGYWDGGSDGIEVRLLYVAEKGYFFDDGCKSNVWVTTVTNNAQEVYPPDGVVAIKAQAESSSTYYLTLKEAIDAVKGRSKARIALNDDVTLEETLMVTNAITLDLAAKEIALGGEMTNAFCFAADVTVSNGTINSSLAANAEGGGLLQFTGCVATLSDLTISGSGCLLHVGDDANVTLTNNCAFACDNAAAIYCSAQGEVTIAGGTYIATPVLSSEDYGVFTKADEVVIAAPDGYLWQAGKLVAGTPPNPVTPGDEGKTYDDATSATNAAAQINANKANSIVVPTGVDGAAKLTYLTKVMATATADNKIVIDLTPAAAVAEQAVVDEASTSETVVAALTSTDESATATISATTPGLYYWIAGGTDVGAVTEPGESVLSTDGGAVELTKPALDATKGCGFFRIKAGVASPTP